MTLRAVQREGNREAELQDPGVPKAHDLRPSLSAAHTQGRLPAVLLRRRLLSGALRRWLGLRGAAQRLRRLVLPSPRPHLPPPLSPLCHSSTKGLAVPSQQPCLLSCCQDSPRRHLFLPVHLSGDPLCSEVSPIHIHSPLHSALVF